MRRPRVRVSSVVFAAFAVVTPAVLLLIALTAFEALTAGIALAVALLLLGACGGVAWWVMRQLAELEARVEGLAPGAAAGIEGEAPGVFGEISTALDRQGRAWASERRALAAKESELEALIDAFPHPLLTIGADHRILTANRAARSWFAAAELEGRAIGTLLRAPEALDLIHRGLMHGVSGQVEFALPQNVERRLDAHVHPLAAAPGAGAHVLLLLEDMTAARRVERMRYDFVANVSHELRTPLSALVALIETLKGPARGDSEAFARFIGMMGEQVARMARLVEDLLSLSRIEMDEHVQPQGRVELAPLLRHVAELLGASAAQRQMRIEVKPAPDLAAVTGNADQLTQLFVNLVDNAIKYARAGTPIRVTAERATLGDGRAAVRVAVADQGEGIAREHVPRLTERFYRVDAGRSRQEGGTGLGLAIVKHVVSRHRGELKIHSEVGVGSVFAVLLPAAAVTELKHD